MKSLFCTTVLALMATGPASGQTAAHALLPPSLARAAAAFDRAQVESDGAALKHLLADNYILFNSGAKVEDKTAFIDDYTAPGFKLQPYHVEQEVIRVWPHGAVLGGVVTLQGASGGKPFKARLRFADVWREQGGSWQVAFTQVTRVP